MLIEEYKRSLKMPQAEEVFDLVFYRPLAFVLVKGIYRLPVTPNQVTLFSLLAGLVAAWFFASGNPGLLIGGAVWYAIANILDCADGQLARLQSSGTLLGRVVDGVADYISSAAIFLGIGFGLAASGASAWWLVFMAGISSALHAMFFDHEQSEFLSASRGDGRFLDGEIAQFAERVDDLKRSRQERMKIFILSFYIRYLKLQQRASTRQEQHVCDPQLYRTRNRVMIRLWSFLGPTTNRSLLIACALSGRIEAYLWIVVVAGNIWLPVCYVLQGRIQRKIASEAGGLPSSDPHGNLRGVS